MRSGYTFSRFAVLPAFLTVAVSATLLATVSTALAGPAEDDYAAAAGNYSQGRWQLSAEEFQKFLANYPQHAQASEAKFFLGEALMQLGQVAQARPYFEAFAKEVPADHRYAAQATFRRGECAYLMGDYQTARPLLADFYQKNKQHSLNAYALPYLGDLALMNNDALSAQQFYSDALRQHRDSALADQCYFGLARSLQMQRKYDDATRFYEFLIAKGHSPLISDSLLHLGRLQYEQEKYDEALATLATVLDKYPTTEVAPYARYWIGVTQLDKGEVDGAIGTFERAAASVEAQHELLPAIVFQLGEAFRQAGRLEEAAAALQQVLDDSPKSSWADDARHGQIRIASDTGQHAAVEQLANAFLENHGSSALSYDVRRLLGRAQLKQQRYEPAITTLNELVNNLDAIASGQAAGGQLSRKDAKSLADSSRFTLGLAYVGAKQYAQADAAIASLTPNEETEPKLAAGVNAVRAAAFMGQQKYTEAIGPLRNYLRLNPDGPDANQSRAQLVVALANTNQLPEAQRAYDNLTTAYTDRNEYLQTTHFLAEAAFRAGEKAWARELFTTLADEDNPPEFREKGLSGKAWCELDLQSPVRSAETFDRLLKEFPDSEMISQAALARAAALEKANDPDGALAMYSLIIDKHPGSKELPQAIYRAAKLCDQLQQDQQAEALLRRYIKDYPQAADMDAALYRLGWVLMDQKRDADGREVFATLHESHPNSKYWPDATFRMAEGAALAGDYEHVAELVDEILASGTSDKVVPYALHLKGQVAARTGRWTDVSPTMEQLLSQFPNSPFAKSAEYWIGESLYRQGKYAESAEVFTSLARRTQGETDTWLAIIPLRRAQVLAHERKWSAAYAMAQDIAEEFPGFSQQYEVDYLLGRCLASQARFQDARDAYERVVNSPHGRRTETAAMAQWNIGETYFHQKDYENAVRAYSRVELLYDFPRWQAMSLLQAGKCFENLNQWSEAADRYQQILNDFAQTEATTEATQRLEAAKQKAGQSGGQTSTGENASTIQPPEIPPLDARSPTQEESR